jgi:hypothetical protein
MLYIYNIKTEIMTEDKIKELFFSAISERGVYKKIGWSITKVSNFKTRLEPTLGDMLEALYKLDKIKVTPNEHSRE